VLNPDAPDESGNWTSESIQPGKVVAVFGDRFRPGEDKVVITQGASTYLIESGSPAWYDSARQINLLLPSGLQAGEAQVYVRHTKGTSQPATITVRDLAPCINPNGVLNPADEARSGAGPPTTSGPAPWWRSSVRT
jgi:uncharacterized protein (TIGR03437 family)